MTETLLPAVTPADAAADSIAAPTAPAAAFPTHEPAPSPASLPWNPAARIAFRFAFAYLTLYCLPDSGRVSLLSALPWGGDWLNNQAVRPWHALCSWTAIHIFRLTGPVTQYHPTGSGDTTLDYMQGFCYAVIAIAATLLWTLLDRRRTQYRALYAWLRLGVRFTLAFTMLTYGFVKVFPLQFGHAGLGQLLETYGESSPMGLLWTFMAASVPYTFFCGLAEVTAGLLLLFRRTATLGALAAAAAMLNIVLLNFCYDVPVKLYSVHLEAIALFLLLPDMPALWSFFILHRPAAPHGIRVPRFERKWLRIATFALQTLVIIAVLYTNLWQGWQGFKQQAGSGRPPLYGVWDVDSFTLGTPASLPSNAAWQRIIAEYPEYLQGRMADNSHFGYDATFDEKKHTMHLDGRKGKGDLQWQQPDPEHLLLQGTLDGKPAAIRLHRFQTKQFLLTSRGFHWISEDPFNR